MLAGMVAHANPGTTEPIPEPAVHPQTVELRLGDGSADVHLLLAGMAVAAKRGLNDPGSLDLAERLNTAHHDDFDQLPTSCAESADVLEAEREMFEADGVFPGMLIDAVLTGLRDTDDTGDSDDSDDTDDTDDTDDGTQRGERADDDDADDAREELIRRHWHVG